MSIPMTTKQQHAERFDSMADFVDATNRPSEMPVAQRSSVEGDVEWTGTTSVEHAQSLAFGWTEGAKRVEAARIRIGAKVGTASRREIRMREVGPGTLSMGAYLSGHPQPYAVIQNRNEARKGRGKIVRVLVNGAASGIVDAKILERRGAAICAAIDGLERAGRRVEVTVVFGVTGSAFGGNRGSKSETYVTVKRAESPLNLAVLAFAIAHPSMLRRLWFRYMEAQPAAIRSAIGVPGGYGMPADVDAPAGALYLPRVMGGEPQWNSEDAAARWVTETLKAQGVSIG